MQEAHTSSHGGENRSEFGKFGQVAGPLQSIMRHFTLLNILFGGLCIGYAYLFYKSIAPYWFHPSWTTDDALQQTFPFHSVYYPEIFKGDLITEVMVGYLAPIHYWTTYFLTWLVGEPIMAGHWVMLIQAVLALSFLFFALKHVAGAAPAFFGVMWLLHTRHVMQRLTGGLPRGWAAAVFAAYFYFAVKGNHWGVLAVFLIGCLVHPPACMLIAVSYGILLTFRLINSETRQATIKPFLTLALLSPLYILTTWYVVDRPDYIGEMVSYEQASNMPEFQKPKGRFPFVPLRDVKSEVRIFGLQAFIGRFYNPGRFWKGNMQYFALGTFALLLLIGWLRRRSVIPDVLLTFLLGTFVVYFASREFAFKLYVPNRHLQFPLAFFFITAFTVGTWRALYRFPAQVSAKVKKLPSWKPDYTSTRLNCAWFSAVGLLALGSLIYAGSNMGLNGAANFNWTEDKNGYVFRWIKNNTPEDALIAGHPTYTDPVPLYGRRRAFITTETSHPFYPVYYQEVKRRLEISLRAHYAKSLKELVEILAPQEIDYFIFERKRFYPEVLAEESYFPPLGEMVEQLTSGDPLKYAYRELPTEMDPDNHPYQVFRDHRAALVHIPTLEKWLSEHKDNK
jgi:hypothetical protein